MKRFGRVPRFWAKLAVAVVPAVIYVLMSGKGAVSFLIAFLLVGAMVGVHLMRADLSGDENIWDSVSVRSIELPMTREELTGPLERALAARKHASEVQRSGFTITGMAGRMLNVGGWHVTNAVHDACGGGSRIVLEVKPAGGDYARGPLDFGGGHRLASSIENQIRGVAAKVANERAPLGEDGAVGGSHLSVGRG